MTAPPPPPLRMAGGREGSAKKNAGANYYAPPPPRRTILISFSSLLFLTRECEKSRVDLVGLAQGEGGYNRVLGPADNQPKLGLKKLLTKLCPSRFLIAPFSPLSPSFSLPLILKQQQEFGW